MDEEKRRVGTDEITHESTEAGKADVSPEVPHGVTATPPPAAPSAIVTPPPEASSTAAPPQAPASDARAGSTTAAEPPSASLVPPQSEPATELGTHPETLSAAPPALGATGTEPPPPFPPAGVASGAEGTSTAAPLPIEPPRREWTDLTHASAQLGEKAAEIGDRFGEKAAEIGERATELGERAVSFASNLIKRGTEMAKQQARIVGLQGQMGRMLDTKSLLLTQAGEKVFALYAKDLVKNADLLALCGRIADLDREIAAREAEIEALRRGENPPEFVPPPPPPEGGIDAESEPAASESLSSAPPGA